jgi:hypothetical protein
MCKKKSSQYKAIPALLLILIVFSLFLTSCGIIDENQAQEGTEGFIEEDWDQENPKRKFTNWWEDAQSEQDDKVKTGFERFTTWISDSINRLLGRDVEKITYVESTPEEFSNKKQVLSAYEFKVPQAVIEYFDQDETLPLDEVILRIEMIASAEAYPRDIRFDPEGTDPFGYRTDGSGFVSYIWQLEKSIDPASMIGQSTEIKIDALKPGDVLNNKRFATAGHMVLFAHWVDFETRSFKGYHMNTTANGVSFNHLVLISDPKVEGAWTIEGIDAQGPFYPYRWNGFILAE